MRYSEEILRDLNCDASDLIYHLQLAKFIDFNNICKICKKIFKFRDNLKDNLFVPLQLEISKEIRE